MEHTRFEELANGKQWHNIIREADGCIDAHPTIARFHFYRGFALYQLRRLEDAHRSLHAAHSLDESQGEAAVLDAMCLEQLDRWRESMDLVKVWRHRLPNEHRLEGLFDFLSTKWDSQEHDRWEESRMAGSKIVFTQDRVHGPGQAVSLTDQSS